MATRSKYWQIINNQPCTTIKELLATLLSDRDQSIQTAEPIADPDIFTDMPIAIKRIWQAVEQKEVMYIYGDYDCDGVTGTAQLVRYFQRKGIGPIVKLPHRVKDGYGLQPKGIQDIIASKASLVITVDTGITAVEEVAALNAANIDVIITDHHEPPKNLPAALAVIHPTYTNYEPPFSPAGAGVVHFLVRALEQDANWPNRAYDELLMMIGTVGDLVPLTGMNRSLVQLGLRRFTEITSSPIHLLLQEMKKECSSLTSETVAFTIVPPINAAGRLADATIALQAVLGNTEQLQLLVQLNDHRKEHTKDLSASITKSAELDEAKKSPLVAVLDEDFHHGIIGLLAGKATEHTGKPSIIATCEEGICTASLRSTVHYNIMDGLHACKHLLLRYGGHAQAAGCSFAIADWYALKKELAAHVESTVNMVDLKPVVAVHAQVSPNLLTMATLKALQTLQPYGIGNPEPQLLLVTIQLADVRSVGADKSHLQCSVHGVKAIGFGFGAYEHMCKTPVDIVCTLQTNSWQGKTTLQLQIIDIRLSV